jgi:serine protease Do
MKNWTKYVAPVMVPLLISGSAFAQYPKDKSSGVTNDKSQEIVIRKNRGNSEKMTIVVDGDNVTINGKPVDEFKNKDITVLKRDRSINVNPRVRSFNAPVPPFDGENFDHMFPASNKAMLGILTSKSTEGVKVTEVTKESGAEKAGLKKDDIITKVGDKEVKEPGELIEAIGSYKPGDKVDLTYKRDGKVSKTSATLGENKSRAFSYGFNNQDFNFRMPEGFVPPMNNFNFNYNRRPKIGMQIQDLEEGKGVSVKDVDENSPAAKAGIKDGDVITQVNGKEVAGVDELREAIKDVKEGETLKFSYKRGGKNQSAEIKIPKRLRTADL